LRITQQALSAYLKRLENHYGISPFNRTFALEPSPFDADLLKKENTGCRSHNVDIVDLKIFSV
jgi:hypothetical protein